MGGTKVHTSHEGYSGDACQWQSSMCKKYDVACHDAYQPSMRGVASSTRHRASGKLTICKETPGKRTKE